MRRAEIALLGELEFVSGPNRGRRLECDEDGRFRASDLYAGFALVRITVPEAATFERELVLRSLRTNVFDLDLASGVRVRGTVRTERGRALPGARVWLDGSETKTAGDGSFELTAAASGEPSLNIERKGLVSYRVRLRPGDDNGPIELRPITLRAGCRLEIELSGVPTSQGPVQVIVVPSGAQPMVRGKFAGTSFPWHTKTPVLVEPGRRVVLTDLPNCPVIVRAFHGLAQGSSREIVLDPAQPMLVNLDLRAVPTRSGRVTAGGRPLADARVSLLAADRSKANAVSLGKEAGVRLAQAIEALPAARQEVHTDRDGRFQLGWWDTSASKKVLLVEGPEGSQVYERVLPDRNIDWFVEL